MNILLSNEMRLEIISVINSVTPVLFIGLEMAPSINKHELL
jgi:hypothetical protein